MSTKISFENSLSKPVTNQQVNSLNSYYKVFRANGTIKKKEFFNTGNLERVLHFMDSSETEATILSNLQSEYPTSEISLVSEDIHSSYSVQSEKFFNTSGNYEGKTEVVIDQNSREICYIDFDENNQIEEIKKTLHSENDVIYYFSYDTNTYELISMSGNTSPFVAEFQYILADQIDFFFPDLLNNHPYYQDGTFLP